MLFEPKVMEVERLVVVVVVEEVVEPTQYEPSVHVDVVVVDDVEDVTATTLVPRKKRSDVTVTSTAALSFIQIPPLVTKSSLTHFLGRFLSLYRPI
jgi:hypothetical protein